MGAGLAIPCGECRRVQPQTRRRARLTLTCCQGHRFPTGTMVLCLKDRAAVLYEYRVFLVRTGLSPDDGCAPHCCRARSLVDLEESQIEAQWSGVIRRARGCTRRRAGSVADHRRLGFASAERPSNSKPPASTLSDAKGCAGPESIRLHPDSFDNLEKLVSPIAVPSPSKHQISRGRDDRSENRGWRQR
jgi:hypothetical protein